MTAIAFVQARMGSRRLPGKSMMAIWQDMPLIELVLRRVAAARLLAQVVLVTSEARADEQLVSVARRLSVGVHRGPEDDVLDRFAGALEHHPADAVVRICADNPFVDPASIDELVRFWEDAQPCDYVSNHTPRSGLPDGSGAEIISAPALRRAASRARSVYDREHVPAYLLSHPESFACRFAPAPPTPWPHLKLDVDTAGDVAAMRRLAAQLPRSCAPLWGRATIVAAAAAAGDCATA